MVVVQILTVLIIVTLGRYIRKEGKTWRLGANMVPPKGRSKFVSLFWRPCLPEVHIALGIPWAQGVPPKVLQ